MRPCPRCHGMMLPTEDDDLRCLLCGELWYGAASAWGAIFDRLAEGLKRPARRQAPKPGDPAPERRAA